MIMASWAQSVSPIRTPWVSDRSLDRDIFVFCHDMCHLSFSNEATLKLSKRVSPTMPTWNSVWGPIFQNATLKFSPVSKQASTTRPHWIWLKGPNQPVLKGHPEINSRGRSASPRRQAPNFTLGLMRPPSNLFQGHYQPTAPWNLI